MAHPRPRIILPQLLKRMKLHPAVGLLGVRQCGKSFLLRELLVSRTKAKYKTMDSATMRAMAERSPEGFTEHERGSPLQIIDEVQKVPAIFDAVKLHVDNDRRPGMYLLSGSTEFSRKTGVREALTGRIGLIYLEPMVLEELHGIKLGKYFLSKGVWKAQLSLSHFERKLTHGGMPGMCFLRSGSEFSEAAGQWFETSCSRDLQKATQTLDPDLAFRILTTIAQSPEPTAAEVAGKLRKDARVIRRYLDAFCAVFVLRRLSPHETGVGKPHYLLCDSGLASELNAPRESILRIHVLNEALAQLSAGGLRRPLLQYYRNAKTSFIPLVLSWGGVRGAPGDIAIQLFEGESPGRREFDSLSAFSKRAPGVSRRLILSLARESQLESSIELHPLLG